MKRFLFLLLMSAHTALGQASDSTTHSGLPPKSNFRYSFISEIGITFASTSLPNIRSFFRSNQIKPDFPIDPMLTLGFGVRYDRLKLGLQVGYGYSNNSQRDKDSLVARQVYNRYTGVLLGYDLANARNRRLYINVGFGNIHYEYNVYRRTNQVVAFQNILQTGQPGTIPSLKLSNNFLDVNLEYTKREKRKQSAENVVRLGYRRSLQAKAWESDAYQITGGPADRISQFYLQVTYYFSSNYTKRSK